MWVRVFGWRHVAICAAFSSPASGARQMKRPAAMPAFLRSCFRDYCAAAQLVACSALAFAPRTRPELAITTTNASSGRSWRQKRRVVADQPAGFPACLAAALHAVAAGAEQGGLAAERRAAARVLQGGDELDLRDLHLVALEQWRQRRHGDRRQYAEDRHHHDLLDQGDAALPLTVAASLSHRHDALLHGRKG